MNLLKPGAGRRLVLLAQTMGIPTSDLSAVVPLIIVSSRSRKEEEVELIGGLANLLATAFGKAKGTEWTESLIPPRELERIKREREERDELLRAKAMLMKIQMMADRYDISEVRE